MIYAFDEFELDTDQLELRRAGVGRKIEPQVFAILELLIANYDRVVLKDEINQTVWGGRIVSEAAVASRIRSARKALNDDGKAQRLIKTVHNRGFRFVGRPVISGAYSVISKDDPIAPTAGQGRPSIAVLPLHLMSDNLRYGSLADAISHEIIADLSRLRWLHVIARGSSFRFREPDVDMSTVGQVLGVGYVLTGSLAIFGKRSRVTVELSKTVDGHVVWADSFEQALDELLSLKLTIVPHIASSVETQIQLNETERVSRLPTENLNAWAAYHRGLWHMFRFNRHDNEVAARMFDRAITADTRFARAHAGLSFTHFQNTFVGYEKNAEKQNRLARKHAETGLELDPHDPFINLMMGRTEMLQNDWESAIPWFNRSTELSPNYALAIYNLGWAEAIRGNGAASERQVTQAISLSPIDPLHYAMLSVRALSHIARGDYETAAHWAERGAKQPTAHVHIWVIACLAHELAGDREKAAFWAAKVRESNPDFKQTQFFQSFPFREETMLASAQTALHRLGI